MNPRPVVPRERARRDVEEAVDFLLAEGGATLALDFIDELARAFGHLSRHPASGSPRHGQELDLPGLRSWPLKHFPYLVSYLERPDHVDVWRILHAARDIPAWLGGSAGS